MMFMKRQNETTPIVMFLQGFMGPHPAGYVVFDVMFGWTDDELEDKHDWVQWCFPLMEPSEMFPHMPHLRTQAEVALLRNDPVVNTHLDLLIGRMEEFYANTRRWRRDHDHNHRRITRILKSLGLIGEPGAAHRFLAFIMAQLRQDAYIRVNEETLGIWRASVMVEVA